MGRKTRAKMLHESWGRRLRDARMHAHLTQAQLAKKLRVTQARISEWESATCPIRDEFKFRLAETLSRSLDELFPWPVFLPPPARECDDEAVA